MPDYKEMYQRMVRASEAAINILIEAQRECEELYINAPEPQISVLPREGGSNKTPRGPLN